MDDVGRTTPSPVLVVYKTILPVNASIRILYLQPPLFLTPSSPSETSDLCQHHFSGWAPFYIKHLTFDLTSFFLWNLSSLASHEFLPFWTLHGWNLVLSLSFKHSIASSDWFTALLSSLSLCSLIYSACENSFQIWAPGRAPLPDSGALFLSWSSEHLHSVSLTSQNRPM